MGSPKGEGSGFGFLLSSRAMGGIIADAAIANITLPLE